MIYIYYEVDTSFVNSIYHVIKKQEDCVKIIDEKLPDTTKNDILIVFSLRHLNKKINGKFIYWNVNPTDALRHWKKYRKNKIKANIQHGVISYVKHHSKIYKSFGCKDFIYVPFGYSEYYEQIFPPELLNSKKNIDILFYGSDLLYFNHREIVINFLKQKGLNIMWVGKDPSDYVFGNDLYELIRRSKIVLSLNHGKVESFKNGEYSKDNDLARLSLLISNKVFVIAEPFGDTHVENDIAKYIPYSESMEDLYEKCVFYLKNPEQRTQISESAYLHFKRNYLLDEYVNFKEIKSRLL